MPNREKVINAVAKLIWDEGMTIGEFYGMIGVSVDGKQPISSVGDTVDELSSIFIRWRRHNPGSTGID